jgi:hypothetical protein
MGNLKAGQDNGERESIDLWVPHVLAPIMPFCCPIIPIYCQ